MKIAKPLFLASLCLLIVLACQKEKSLKTPVVTGLDAGKRNLQKGEPLTIQLNNVPQGARVAWNVMPAQNVLVQTNNNKATFVFNQAGSYTINAARILSSDSTIIFCDTVIVGDTTGHWPPSPCDTVINGDTVHIPCDTIYHPSPCDTVINGDTVYIPCDTTNHDTIPSPTSVDITNDQLVVTPSLSDTSIAFTVRTVNSYNCLNAYISYGTTINDSIIYLSHSAVVLPPSPSCVQGQATVSCLHLGNPLSHDGTFPIHIQKGSTGYSGSVTVSGNGTKYTFNWPYTSGVTFTTTVVQR
jgi:hypothetical protein